MRKHTGVFSRRKRAIIRGGNGPSPKMHIPKGLSSIFGPAATLTFYLFQENYSTGIICESLDYLALIDKYCP